MIISLTGNMHCGKDTVAKMIQWYFAQKTIERACFNHFPTLKEYLDGDDSFSQSANKYSRLSEHCGWSVRKFASKLKQIAADLVGCRVEDFESEEFKSSLLSDSFQYSFGIKCVPFKTYRWLLQHLADKIKELLGEDYFVDELFSNYEESKIKNAEPNQINDEPGILRRTRNLESNWIISDMRYIKEESKVKELGGIVIKIERGEKRNNTHSSETELSQIKADFTIQNNGTIQELYEQVSEILNQLNQPTTSNL